VNDIVIISGALTVRGGRGNRIMDRRQSSDAVVGWVGDSIACAMPQRLLVATKSLGFTFVQPSLRTGHHLTQWVHQMSQAAQPVRELTGPAVPIALVYAGDIENTAATQNLRQGSDS
jgi:hypothetical protein